MHLPTSSTLHCPRSSYLQSLLQLPLYCKLHSGSCSRWWSGGRDRPSKHSVSVALVYGDRSRSTRASYGPPSVGWNFSGQLLASHHPLGSCHGSSSSLCTFPPLGKSTVLSPTSSVRHPTGLCADSVLQLYTTGEQRV